MENKCFNISCYCCWEIKIGTKNEWCYSAI